MFVSGNIFDAVLQSDYETVRRLLSKGASVNEIDQFGESLLHIAAKAGDAKMCHLLLSHGADPRLEDSNGDGPADLAFRGNHTEALRNIVAVTQNLQAMPKRNVSVHRPGDAPSFSEVISKGSKMLRLSLSPCIVHCGVDGFPPTHDTADPCFGHGPSAHHGRLAAMAAAMSGSSSHNRSSLRRMMGMSPAVDGATALNRTRQRKRSDQPGVPGQVGQQQIQSTDPGDTYQKLLQMPPAREQHQIQRQALAQNMTAQSTVAANPNEVSAPEAQREFPESKATLGARMVRLQQEHQQLHRQAQSSLQSHMKKDLQTSQMQSQPQQRKQHQQMILLQQVQQMQQALQAWRQPENSANPHDKPPEQKSVLQQQMALKAFLTQQKQGATPQRGKQLNQHQLAADRVDNSQTQTPSNKDKGCIGMGEAGGHGKGPFACMFNTCPGKFFVFQEGGTVRIKACGQHNHPVRPEQSIGQGSQRSVSLAGALGTSGRQSGPYSHELTDSGSDQGSVDRNFNLVASGVGQPSNRNMPTRQVDNMLRYLAPLAQSQGKSNEANAASMLSVQANMLRPEVKRKAVAVAADSAPKAKRNKVSHRSVVNVAGPVATSQRSGDTASAGEEGSTISRSENRSAYATQMYGLRISPGIMHLRINGQNSAGEHVNISRSGQNQRGVKRDDPESSEQCVDDPLFGNGTISGGPPANPVSSGAQMTGATTLLNLLAQCPEARTVVLKEMQMNKRGIRDQTRTASTAQQVGMLLQAHIADMARNRGGNGTISPAVMNVLIAGLNTLLTNPALLQVGTMLGQIQHQPPPQRPPQCPPQQQQDEMEPPSQPPTHPLTQPASQPPTHSQHSQQQLLHNRQQLMQQVSHAQQMSSQQHHLQQLTSQQRRRSQQNEQLPQQQVQQAKHQQQQLQQLQQYLQSNSSSHTTQQQQLLLLNFLFCQKMQLRQQHQMMEQAQEFYQRSQSQQPQTQPPVAQSSVAQVQTQRQKPQKQQNRSDSHQHQMQPVRLGHESGGPQKQSREFTGGNAPTEAPSVAHSQHVHATALPTSEDQGNSVTKQQEAYSESQKLANFFQKYSRNENVKSLTELEKHPEFIKLRSSLKNQNQRTLIDVVVEGMRGCHDWAIGQMWIPDQSGTTLTCVSNICRPSLDAQDFIKYCNNTKLQISDESLPCRVYRTGQKPVEVVQLKDEEHQCDFHSHAAAAGLQSVYGMLVDVTSTTWGVLVFYDDSDDDRVWENSRNIAYSLSSTVDADTHDHESYFLEEDFQRDEKVHTEKANGEEDATERAEKLEAQRTTATVQGKEIATDVCDSAQVMSEATAAHGMEASETAENQLREAPESAEVAFQENPQLEITIPAECDVL